LNNEYYLNGDNSNYHGQHKHMRLTREHHALVARLENAKTVYADLWRALLVGLELTVTPKAIERHGELSKEPGDESELATEASEDPVNFGPKKQQRGQQASELMQAASRRRTSQSATRSR
jgi:hypothetical protein